MSAPLKLPHVEPGTAGRTQGLPRYRHSHTLYNPTTWNLPSQSLSSIADVRFRDSWHLTHKCSSIEGCVPQVPLNLSRGTCACGPCDVGGTYPENERAQRHWRTLHK